jgi:hypothetical protein
METFTFTDNRGIHKHIVTLTASQLAEHLSNDLQFMFYWRKDYDPRLAATRSLYQSPPNAKAIVCPTITEAQWPEIHQALCAIHVP